MQRYKAALHYISSSTLYVEKIRKPGDKQMGSGVYNYHFVGADLEKTEESRSPDVLTAAVSSTGAAFLVISLLTFVAGFVCGHYFGRKYTVQTSSLSQPVPLYEDMNVLPSAVEHQEQGLELKENVAYEPSNL